MKSKRNTSLNKKGSYIVEATIVVPVFIMAVMLLIGIIPVISICENITYAAADEMRLEMAKSAFRNNPAALPISLKMRAGRENNDLTSFHVTSYLYKYRSNNINDLIKIQFHSTFKKKNPLGLFSAVSFKGALTGRAFTGTYYRDLPASRSDIENDGDSRIVYIFPNWGNCYHNKNCSYIHSNCHLVYLSQDVRNDFHACPLCGAGNASVGTPVFCFENSGEAYHLSGCSSVKKYYIDIERKEAVKKGYVPCSKCGGE
jgi:hypothetical protein